MDRLPSPTELISMSPPFTSLDPARDAPKEPPREASSGLKTSTTAREKHDATITITPASTKPPLNAKQRILHLLTHPKSSLHQCYRILTTFLKFTGPGALISVAYIDPDNFQTALSAGSLLQYSPLFTILLSNLLAIYLQSLAVKLGSVTGLDLAQVNRLHLNRWVNWALYAVAEASIVCADVGQVIGTAIALNILSSNRIPLVAGCLLAAFDTLFVLLFYRPNGTLRALRAFEVFVSFFVLGMFVTFCIQLSYVATTGLADVADVFRGFLPSGEVVRGEGLYQSCAILGGTLMPHSLYLGSGLCQARMRAFEREGGSYGEVGAGSSSSGKNKVPLPLPLYRPSVAAIKATLGYSIAELVLTLFIVAITVNGAILIIAGAYFYGSDEAQDADLFTMYALFSTTISPLSGTIFAVSLLLSGLSAGIVATLAGQLVSEGALNWRVSPWLRRLVTRSVAVVPGVVVAAVGGREGLAAALMRCNVVMSGALVVVVGPLVVWTSCTRYMLVKVDAAPVGAEAGVSGASDRGVASEAGDEKMEVEVERGELVEVERGEGRVSEAQMVSFANNWVTTIAGFLIWLVIAGMNVATLVFVGLGVGGD